MNSNNLHLKKKNLRIIPYESLGDVCLGKDKSEIRSLFGNDFQSKKVSFTNTSTDYFLNSAIQVEYDNFGFSIFIGASKPIVAKYDSIDLLELDHKNLVHQFGNIDRNIFTEPNSIILLDTGFCFYFNEFCDKCLPEQVSIFKKGYYDSILYLYKQTYF